MEMRQQQPHGIVADIRMIKNTFNELM